MHRQGIALWGGPSFSRLHRFSHPNVRCPVRGCEGFAGFQGLGLLSAPSRPHMHRQGIALWGGPSFSRLHRFSHPNVRCPVRGCEGFAGFQGLGLLSAPSRPHMHRQGIALWGGPLLQPPAPLLAPQRALPRARL